MLMACGLTLVSAGVKIPEPGAYVAAFSILFWILWNQIEYHPVIEEGTAHYNTHIYIIIILYIVIYICALTYYTLIINI